MKLRVKIFFSSCSAYYQSGFFFHTNPARITGDPIPTPHNAKCFSYEDLKCFINLTAFYFKCKDLSSAFYSSTSTQSNPLKLKSHQIPSYFPARSFNPCSPISRSHQRRELNSWETRSAPDYMESERRVFRN